jgi:hypothetical protein
MRTFFGKLDGGDALGEGDKAWFGGVILKTILSGGRY